MKTPRINDWDSSQLSEDTASCRLRPTVTGCRYMAGVSSALMGILFEAAASTAMTTDLAVGLAQLVRATRARRPERPNCAA
jgi:hypothetical protein